MLQHYFPRCFPCPSPPRKAKTGRRAGSSTAAKRGGAIANSDHSVLGLDDRTFSDTRAATGGAVANDYRVRIVLPDCKFAKNQAAHEPDIAADGSSPISRDRSEWPDQSEQQSFGPPRGFGPPEP